MKIDRVSTPGTTALRRNERSKGARKGTFAESLSEEVSAPSGNLPVSGVSPVEALLSIQEVPDSASQRSRGLLRGTLILDELEELRHGLILGTLTRAQIDRLKALVEHERTKVDDPGLAEVLNEVEIRAAVELAKLER